MIFVSVKFNVLKNEVHFDKIAIKHMAQDTCLYVQKNESFGDIENINMREKDNRNFYCLQTEKYFHIIWDKFSISFVTTDRY